VNTILQQLSSSTPIHQSSSPQTPFSNNGSWRHLANKIKTYCEQENGQIFNVWNSHRQHAARLFHTVQYDRLSFYFYDILTKIDNHYQRKRVTSGLEQCVEVNMNKVVIKILQGSVGYLHKPC